MASFLQNSGDIILDAVLTDYGRKLLAKGDGSFNIVKFAFSDDEIDYGLFVPGAESSQQDIQIMNTPILEAFTNNAASMKSQLLTLTLENILYMPVLELASGKSNSKTGIFGQTDQPVFTGYVIPVDFSEVNSNNSTSNKLKTSTNGPFMAGVQSPAELTSRIIVHQGLDSSELDPFKSLRSENPALYEEEYSIYWDYRYASLVDLENAGNTLTPLSIDDDGIATYRFSQQSTTSANSAVTEIDYLKDTTSPILGTKGSQLQFKLVPNSNLKNQDTYFTKYGTNLNLNPNTGFTAQTFKTLRTTIRVVGNTTGYNLEIPIMFAKI